MRRGKALEGRRGYLLMLQLGNALFSSAMPASVTWVSSSQSSCSMVSPLRYTSPVSVIRVQRERVTPLSHH